jgi:hypothetical protein
MAGENAIVSIWVLGIWILDIGYWRELLRRDEYPISNTQYPVSNTGFYLLSQQSKPTTKGLTTNNRISL